MKVANKVIVITGAGSGMGRELAIQLVNKGAKVALLDINQEALAETAKIAGAQHCSIHQVNVTNLESITLLPDLIIKHHGTIDGIINNAGIIQPFIPINDLEYETIKRVMDVNFYGTVYMTKTFLPYLLQRPEAHIANVTSMGGFIPFPGQSVYSASKAAVKMFTEGLYGELKNTNVGVTIIHPGAINTNIMGNSGLETNTASQEKAASNNKMLSATKAAEIMIDAIEKNKFRVMVGKDASFLDKLYRLSPKFAVNFIVKNMSKSKH